jgi:hypothetical protein
MGSSGRSRWGIFAGGSPGARISGVGAVDRGAADLWSSLRPAIRSPIRSHARPPFRPLRAPPADLWRDSRRRAGQRRGGAGAGGPAGGRKRSPVAISRPDRQPRRNRPRDQELRARRRSEPKLSGPLFRHRACARLLSRPGAAVRARDPDPGQDRRWPGDPRRRSGACPTRLRQLRWPGGGLGRGGRRSVRLAGPRRHRLPDARLVRLLAGDRPRPTGVDARAARRAAGPFPPCGCRCAGYGRCRSARTRLRRRTSRQMR